MPDLSPTIDGNLLKIGNTWAGTVGDGTSANSINTTNTYRNSGINAIDRTTSLIRLALFIGSFFVSLRRIDVLKLIKSC